MRSHGGSLGVAAALVGAVAVGLLGTPSARRRRPVAAPALSVGLGWLASLAAVWGSGATRDAGLAGLGAAVANTEVVVDEVVTAVAGAVRRVDKALDTVGL